MLEASIILLSHIIKIQNMQSQDTVDTKRLHYIQNSGKTYRRKKKHNEESQKKKIWLLPQGVPEQERITRKHQWMLCPVLALLLQLIPPARGRMLLTVLAGTLLSLSCCDLLCGCTTHGTLRVPCFKPSHIRIKTTKQPWK